MNILTDDIRELRETLGTDELIERLRRVILARREAAPGEPDLVECECGIVFTPLRCPAHDCQSEKHGLALVSLAEKRTLEALAGVSVYRRSDGDLSLIADGAERELCAALLAHRGRVVPLSLLREKP